MARSSVVGEGTRDQRQIAAAALVSRTCVCDVLTREHRCFEPPSDVQNIGWRSSPRHPALCEFSRPLRLIQNMARPRQAQLQPALGRTARAVSNKHSFQRTACQSRPSRVVPSRPGALVRCLSPLRGNVCALRALSSTFAAAAGTSSRPSLMSLSRAFRVHPFPTVGSGVLATFFARGSPMLSAASPLRQFARRACPFSHDEYEEAASQLYVVVKPAVKPAGIVPQKDRAKDRCSRACRTELLDSLADMRLRLHLPSSGRQMRPRTEASIMRAQLPQPSVVVPLWAGVPTSRLFAASGDSLAEGSSQLRGWSGKTSPCDDERVRQFSDGKLLPFSSVVESALSGDISCSSFVAGRLRPRTATRHTRARLRHARVLAIRTPSASCSCRQLEATFGHAFVTPGSVPSRHSGREMPTPAC
mmetsp:Transcript_175893/g.563939  ORF Transcript_175893/g.563939 Transcript_175893/m.563939 type:complete len:417 (-) Transcript_175893:771-2021(-)